MTDSASSRYGARQQSQGSNTNSWGDDKLNEVLRLFDRGSKGVQSLAMTGDTTLSWTNYVATNDGQCAVLLLTGSLSSAATLTVPSKEWNWDAIKNSTGQTITVKTSAGSGVAIANGKWMQVYCDASDCYNGSSTILPGATTVAGALTIAGILGGVTAGVAATDGVNKTQMETAIATASLPATAGNFFVDANDTTPGYAGQKITAGTGIDLSTNNPSANSNLQIDVDTTELEEFLALTGKVTATLSAGTTAMTARRRYRVSSTATGTLPTMIAGDFVIVEFTNAIGVTATVGRNSQTIDGAAADDTYIGTGATGAVVRYDYASAGVVTSRLIEGVPF